jgi:hypothetical protein
MKRCSLFSTMSWETVPTASHSPLTLAPKDCTKWDGVDCSTLDALNLLVCQADQKGCTIAKPMDTKAPETTPPSVPDACKKFHGKDCNDLDDAASSAACVLNHQRCATMTATPEPPQESSPTPVEPLQTSSIPKKGCTKAEISVFCFGVGWPGNGAMSLKCEEMRKLCGLDPVT